MSLQYKTFDEYRNAVAPRLDNVIASRRDAACEFALAHGFLLYSFIIEDMQATATRNQSILNKVGVMLVELQDVLRGIVHGMKVLSPVLLAVLSRVAFEIRCNLKFIYSRLDPSIYADRYVRFGKLNTLAHDERKPLSERLLSDTRRQELLRECDEWVRRPSPDGTFKFDITNWTGEEKFRTLKLRAKDAGLERQYEDGYTAMSLYVHATSLIENGYRGPDGNINALGNTIPCRRVASIGSISCLHAALEAVQFFGLPFDQFEYDCWFAKLQGCSPDVNANKP